MSLYIKLAGGKKKTSIWSKHDFSFCLVSPDCYTNTFIIKQLFMHFLKHKFHYDVSVFLGDTPQPIIAKVNQGEYTS